MIESFIEAYPGTISVSGRQGIQRALVSAHEQACAQWTDFTVSAQAFAAFLGTRAPTDDVRTWLVDAPVADLYLACACVAGDESAAACFVDEHGARIAGAVARLRIGPQQRDDICARVRTKLLVATARPPGIAKYRGTGPLAAWVGTVAAREGISYLRQQRGDEQPSDAELFDPIQEDPELQYLKATYRAAFREAFQRAVADLSARERTLLKYQYIDGLGSRKIATLYGVHHATAARWLQSARTALLNGTRDELMRKLSITSDEVDSVMRLIQSRWDVTVRRLLDD